MTFYLKGYQNYQKSKLKFPKGLNLLIVADLTPLEIKRHTVPHLKALTRSIERKGRHGHFTKLSFFDILEFKWCLPLLERHHIVD